MLFVDAVFTDAISHVASRPGVLLLAASLLCLSGLLLWAARRDRQALRLAVQRDVACAYRRRGMLQPQQPVVSPFAYEEAELAARHALTLVEHATIMSMLGAESDVRRVLPDRPVAPLAERVVRYLEDELG